MVYFYLQILESKWVKFVTFSKSKTYLLIVENPYKGYILHSGSGLVANITLKHFICLDDSIFWNEWGNT